MYRSAPTRSTTARSANAPKDWPISQQTLGSGAKLSCAIAYDTRQSLGAFARLLFQIMTAAGFHGLLPARHRRHARALVHVRKKTMLVRHQVTASHNPPKRQRVKVYWSTGGQIVPPHDKGIIDRVMNVQEIKRADLDQMAAVREDHSLPG